jgi:hypothetical protein
MAGRQGLALVKSTAVGTILQLILVAAGHFTPSVARLFAQGGMGISGVAGLLYAVWGGKASAGGAAGGGAVAGGACALIGILISHLLGDVPATIIGVGTAGSAVTGAIGGMLGRVLSAPSSTAH